MSPEFSLTHPKQYGDRKISAVQEMLDKNPERLATSISDFSGKRVFLSDGSTSIANCRAIELATTLVAGKNMEGVAREIIVDVVGGGPALLASQDLGIEILRLKKNNDVFEILQTIFPKVIFDERNLFFLPPEAFFLPVSGRSLREANLKARGALIAGAALMIGIKMPPIKVIAFEEMESASKTTLKQILDENVSNPKNIIVKFICPECSRQRCEAIEHGILPNRTVVRSTGSEIKCKAARDLTHRFEEGSLEEIPLSQLIKLGFYISGKALYQLSTEDMDPNQDVLLVRNYSNSRGTVLDISKRWAGKLALTRRFYFADKEEITGRGFIKRLRQNQNLVNAIKSEPILVNGHEEDIYLPC